MGRRSSRPSGSRRAASPRPPARSASTSTRRSAAPPARRPAAPRPAPSRSASTAPATQKASAAPPPATQQPKQGSAMGGFMANVASTGLGVAAGRAIDRALFGGAGAGPAPTTEDLGSEGAPAYGESEFAAGPNEVIEESACAREALEFKKCLERSSNDVASCQWNIDILAACQQQQAQLGFADAGRL